MEELTRQRLADIFHRHARPVLYCSGGKDSTTMLHLARPWAAQGTVLHVDQGADGWPDVRERLEANCAAWGYAPPMIVPSPISLADYQAHVGHPVTIVPFAMDGVSPNPFRGDDPPVASWWHCSTVKVLLPLIEATLKLQADAGISATKDSDAIGFTRMDAATDATQTLGWVRYDPLKEWSTAAIWAYVDREQIQLPAYYAHSRAHPEIDWPDCQGCTFNLPYLAWLKREMPELWATMAPSVLPVFHAIETKLEGHLIELHAFLEET